MTYGVYRQARNASWHCLLDCNIRELPVSPAVIVRLYGLDCRYRTAEALGGRSGMIIRQADSTRIYINRQESIFRQRFTVLHELGHYLLGHLGDVPFSRCEDELRSSEEQAADKFAIDVLAPACVLWGMGIRTADEISSLCRISYQAAVFRAERMRLLYQRGMFLAHPLEKRVYAQFLPYIRKNRKQFPE